MNEKKLFETLHPLERKVLPFLRQTGEFEQLVKNTGLQKVEVMRALQWLSNKKLVTLKEDLTAVVELDKQGKIYKKHGLPEHRFLQHLERKHQALIDIKNKADLTDQEVAVCLGLLRKLQAIELTKRNGALLITITKTGEELKKKGFPEAALLKKHFPTPLSSFSEKEKGIIEKLKHRKNILSVDLQKNISASITALGEKTAKIHTQGDIHDRLTPELIKSGKWKEGTFRRYDVTINVPPIYGGKRHFVQQAISYIKSIWLDLGFTEMTGESTQTAFWTLDALFVPQDHSARDMQDSFFIKDPSKGSLPPELSKKVQAAHENGGDTGSLGWRYKWSVEEAKKIMMITHDTYLSARTIANVKPKDLPIKTFQIMKVFRNEALSWKHLFEFYQIGGIVVDPKANFRNLQGYLKEFFGKMGFTKIRLRPADFPYTFCSTEVDVFDPRKKQWMEVAGSGIFRPEMVKPLLGIDCPVLAWGIGLERSIMEYYGFKDVRDVYRNDLKVLRESKLWMK